MTNTYSRRLVLGGALAGLLGTAAPAVAAPRLRLTLPTPTGPHPVGRTSLHLVDHARQDPWWSTPHPRELMVSLWYPTTKTGRRGPWMTPGALAHYRTELETFLGDPVSLAGVDFPVTHAHENTPPRKGPVVLYSPGYGAGRELGTVLVEDLASHGYIVVAISHTYEAGVVEFPGGRVELGRHDANDPSQEPHAAAAIRRADTQFVLDQLAARGVDLSRVGMFGHSIGGATTAQTMLHDNRITAGLNMDGSFFPDVPITLPPDQVDAALVALADGIGDRPFMIMGSNGFGPDYFGSLTSIVWYHLRGWRRFVSLTGTTHFSYTDHQVLLPQLGAAGIVRPDVPWVGTIDPARAIAAERAYLRAFFDQHLRGRDNHLLDGPSATYPEAVFY